MADFKSYKGDDGNWKKEFVKSGANNQYNEGNTITTLGSPIWSTGQRGFNPVTEKHDPCGVWNREYIPNPFIPVVTTVINPAPLRYIAWSPNVGDYGLGRYVASHYTDSFFYYSDDGGLNWTIEDNSWLPYTGGLVVQPLHFVRDYGDNGVFVAGYDTLGGGGFYCGSAISEDGINWTAGTNLDVPGRAFTEINYSPAAGKFFGCTSTGGARSHLYDSPDGLVWTHRYSLGLYTRYFLTQWKGVCLLYGQTPYDSPYYSANALDTLTYTTLGNPWYPYEFDFSSDREQVHGDNENLYYSGCVAGSNGIFEAFDQSFIFRRMDYNPANGWFASFDRATSPNHLIFRRSEYGWNDIGHNGHSCTDVAVGDDRAVFAQQMTCAVVTGLNV